MDMTTHRVQHEMKFLYEKHFLHAMVVSHSDGLCPLQGTGNENGYSPLYCWTVVVGSLELAEVDSFETVLGDCVNLYLHCFGIVARVDFSPHH